MTYKTNKWKTKWGKTITGVYREGKNDWNTNQAIISDDEYLFNRLPISKEGTAVDIGGFVGSAALCLASMGLSTIVVEPLSDNLKCIQEAVKLNSFEEKIKIYHRAIGDNDTDAIHIFLGDQSNENGKVHEFIGTAFGGSATSEKELVRTISLNTIFLENNIDKCPILKIDCEGGEWACFQGASIETLDKIQYIVGELHCCGPHTQSTAYDFLELFRGRFQDISGSMGLAIDSQGLGSFVLEHI